MDVAPHPHTGLQTVSWLFSGEVEHRDSAGVHAMVRPGELNLMTAGAGICHSEVSVAGSGPATRILHGAQLWVALPDADRDTGRDFAHYVPSPLGVDGARLRVFLGELAGTRSPVSTFTPLLGAQIDLRPDPRSPSTSTAPSNTACCSTRAASLPAAPPSTSPTSGTSRPATTHSPGQPG